MPRFTKKKAAAVGVASVLVATGAYAYWTSGGEGTGTADTGVSADLVAHQTSVVTDMAPGVAAQDLSGDFVNDTDSAVYVATVTASIGAITGNLGVCTAADYTLTNAVSTVGEEVLMSTPDGTHVGDWGLTDTPTIEFDSDPLVNQDGCQNAQVQILYVVA